MVDVVAFQKQITRICTYVIVENSGMLHVYAK
jgi:hypothetical protein